MLTPQPVDGFSRYQAELFDEKQVISVPTGFQAFFGNPASGSLTHYSPDANAVDIDIIRGNKRTAALIPRGMVSRPLGANQKNMLSGKFSSFARSYPLSEEEGDITANEIQYRLPGEPANSVLTRQERLRERARAIYMESVRRTVRLFEILARESVLTGKQPAILDTTNDDLVYDFRRNTSHTITVSTPWNGTSPGIIADIEGACEKLESNGNTDPNFMGVGGEALEAMIMDTTFQTLADNRRFELIQVGEKNPVPKEFDRFVGAGWRPRGLLRTPKGYNLWIFAYNKTYVNSAGVVTKLMDESKAFITSTEVRCDRYFGPPEMLPMIPQRVQIYRELFGINPLTPPMPSNIKDPGGIVDPSMFYCDCYLSNNSKSVTIRTQSAPIFATTQTDGFAVLNGLVS